MNLEMLMRESGAGAWALEEEPCWGRDGAEQRRVNACF